MKENVVFCSECGAQLDEFWQTPESKDPALTKARSEWCKKQGRFTGEMCSKHFISNPDAVLPPLDDAEDEQ
ncbi:MAG: hypothetical protein NTV54_07280 [Ignavibacteriales bacterium]|nr:hypothetical protein [Ignavibacteriales bacterium]